MFPSFQLPLIDITAWNNTVYSRILWWSSKVGLHLKKTTQASLWSYLSPGIGLLQVPGTTWRMGLLNFSQHFNFNSLQQKLSWQLDRTVPASAPLYLYYLIPAYQAPKFNCLVSAPNKTWDPLIHHSPSTEIPVIWILVLSGGVVFVEYTMLCMYLILSTLQCKNALCFLCATT